MTKTARWLVLEAGPRLAFVGLSSMEYTNLGSSGLKISKVILGCMSFGDKRWVPWVLEEDEALPLLEHAYKAGINTWDTADVNSMGRSEQIVGKALKKYRICLLYTSPSPRDS